MFAQEPPPDFDVPGRREPGERPELVAEVGLVEVSPSSSPSSAHSTMHVELKLDAPDEAAETASELEADARTRTGDPFNYESESITFRMKRSIIGMTWSGTSR
jgi:hypothetical protein